MSLSLPMRSKRREAGNHGSFSKLDTNESRPKIFRQNKLSILPVENGKYIIFRDESAKTYYPLGKILADVPAEEYLPRKDYSEYQSLDVGNLSSESQV